MAYKPDARVAYRTLRRIDGVDGVPTTHTQRGWVHAWTVTDGIDAAAPRPFAAKKGVPAWVAVPAMCALVLTVMAWSLVVVLDGHDDAAAIVLGVFGLLAVWTVLLILPALVRAARR